MGLPNFLIVGAAKCGTTSLWEYLRQHPAVRFSKIKEPNYFALAGQQLPEPGPAPARVIKHVIHPDSITDFGEYQALFDGIDDSKAVGEASVRYLYYEQTPQRIRDVLPNVRIIAILREPAARLYSHYTMNVQFQLEPLDVMDALDAEDERVAAGWGWDWHYSRVSSYAGQIQRYLTTFAPEQIKVYLYDDFVEQPLAVFRDICKHLEIDPEFVPDMSKREKVTTWPRFLALDRWINWPNDSRTLVEKVMSRRATRSLLRRVDSLNRRSVPRVDPQIRAAIKSRFRGDIADLESLLQRKTGWV